MLGMKIVIIVLICGKGAGQNREAKEKSALLSRVLLYLFQIKLQQFRGYYKHIFRLKLATRVNTEII
jgi:hypothetical protein